MTRSLSDSPLTGREGRLTTRRLEDGRVGPLRPGTPDQQPEQDRYFRDLERQRHLADERFVPRQDQGGEGSGQIGRTRDHQQDAQYPGDETRPNDENPERKQPEAPEDRRNDDSLAMQTEESPISMYRTPATLAFFLIESMSSPLLTTTPAPAGSIRESAVRG